VPERRLKIESEIQSVTFFCANRWEDSAAQLEIEIIEKIIQLS